MELFPAHILDILPAPSRAKVLLLDEQRTASHAATKAADNALFEAHERRDALEVKVRHAIENSVAAHHRKLSDEERQHLYRPVRAVEQEIAERLTPRRDRAAAVWDSYSFLAEVSQWLREARNAGVKLEPAAAPSPRGDFHNLVETSRRRLDELSAEWNAAEEAPRPVADARAAIVSEIDDLAEKGRPTVDLRIREGAPLRIAPAFGILGEGNAHASLAHAVIWLGRDILIERALALLPESDLPGVMTDVARDKVFDRITAERLKVEREEEASISAAAVVGIVIARRRDADPRAVLEVQEA